MEQCTTANGVNPESLQEGRPANRRGVVVSERMDSYRRFFFLTTFFFFAAFFFFATIVSLLSIKGTGMNCSLLQSEYMIAY